MSTYVKAAMRLTVLFALIVAVLVLIQPMPSAASQCTDQCHADWVACEGGCHGQFGCNDICNQNLFDCNQCCFGNC